jgi:hypothetical protein
MLLRAERNPRARSVLIDMIAELESRPIVSGFRVPVTKDGPPVVRRVSTATTIALTRANVPGAALKFN